MDTHTQKLPHETREAVANCHSLVSDEWTEMSRRIPVDVEALAQETKALQRKRKVRSATDLLRMVLAYSVCDWSLRLVGIWATVIGLAALSDIAVRKRLLNAQKWLGSIIGSWLQQRRLGLEKRAVVLRLIDASHVSQPGSRGIDWRLHVNFDLGSFSIADVEVTDVKGGETLLRHKAREGEILVADRGYAHRRGVGQTLAASAYLVVRSNGHNLPLETYDGQRFDLLGWLQAETSLSRPGEKLVWVTTPEGHFALRLLAQPLPKEAAEEARRRVRQRSRKKGHTPNKLSLVAAGYVLLLTNLPAPEWTGEQVLALYRLRWQVELLFKRLKSILNLADLRTKNPVLAQVYLLGKLVAALMLEDWCQDPSLQLADWFEDVVRPISPWRWTCLWADLLRQAIRGPMTLARVLNALPQLGRYLRQSPRKRRQQAAHARKWLNAQVMAVETFDTAKHHEPASVYSS